MSKMSPRFTPLRRMAMATVLGLGLTSHAKDNADAGLRDSGTAGEILIRLRSTQDLNPLLARYGLSLGAQFGARPIYRLVVAGQGRVDAIIRKLGREPAVIQAERNYLHSSPEARGSSGWAIGTETQYAEQWAPAALRLPQAHQLSTGTGVRVAVLDTGIDTTHPALAGRLLPGYDFVDGDLDPSEVGAPGTHPAFGHGTHVAGLVALVAPGAKIMPLRVLDPAGGTNAWVLGEAMLHAVDPDGNPATDDGAHVINLSLGSTSRTEILDALAQLSSCNIPAVVTAPADDFTDPGFDLDKQRCALQRGAVVVAAAGNDASADIRQYPAAEGAYGLLPVTASNASARIADIANFGGWIDAAAPGEGMTSPVPGGGYGTWSGTSMAAAVASGTAALVTAHQPSLSSRDLVRRLSRVAGTLCGSQIPRIDAAAALENVPPPATPCR